MIKFSHSVISYGTKVVLNIDELNIKKGALLPVIGKNGSGKTTLIRAIAGLIPVQGIAKQGRVVYQPQKPYIFHTTCEKNILSAMTVPDRDKAKLLLKQTGLAGYENRKAGNLSGGECARLALARTMALSADIYLLDEPFAAIDEASAAALAQILKEHCLSEQAALLLPIHNFGLAAQISSDVLLIHAGTAELVPIEEARTIYQSEILEGSGLC